MGSRDRLGTAPRRTPPRLVWDDAAPESGPRVSELPFPALTNNINLFLVHPLTLFSRSFLHYLSLSFSFNLPLSFSSIFFFLFLRRVSPRLAFVSGNWTVELEGGMVTPNEIT